MAKSSHEVIKELEKDGWELYSVKGSHHHYKYLTKKGRETVPHPKRDLPTGTVKSIYRQAGFGK